MNTLEEIRVAITQRLEIVRAAKDEYDRLERALEALGPFVEPEPPARRRAPRRRPKPTPTPEAPYGYKADGTPRKRPGRRKSEEPPSNGKGAPETATLRITTGNVPAVKDDAEPVYVTQEG